MCNNTVIPIISSINFYKPYNKAHHLTNVSSFTFLTRRSRQALDGKQEKLNMLFGHDRCRFVVKCYFCCPAHLQTNWAWRSGESSGSFVSLLAEQTLLTSGTRLTICALKRDHSQERQMLVRLTGSQLQQVRYWMNPVTLTAGPGAPTGPWGPVGPGGPCGEEGKRQQTHPLWTFAVEGTLMSGVVLTYCFHRDSHALLCLLCFPSGRALQSLPVKTSNHSVRNPK